MHMPLIMNKKTIGSIMALLIATMAVLGTPFIPFTSWDELTKNSPDIVIARCINNPDPMVTDSGIHSEIDVISVLKGNTKPTYSRMVAHFRPRQDQCFLMFSTYQIYDDVRIYNAQGDYKIVPISSY